jgi:transketolase
VFRSAVDTGAELEAEWNQKFDSYRSSNPDLAATFEQTLSGKLTPGWDADLPKWSPGDKPIATRKASEAVIQAFFPKVPAFFGGSADLNPSTNTGMKGAGDFEPAPAPQDFPAQGTVGGEWDYAGRNVHFGVREHAMGSSVNGMAAHGGLIPFGATFLVFSDYMRPAIRLAALSHLKSIFVFTHDSIAVGEDGPTHEPVEHVMSLRLIPNLRVIRPADPSETADAWRVALESEGPTALILTRQDLAVLDTAAAKGNLKQGGYVLVDAVGKPDLALIATGSEVDLAVKARTLLADRGVQARVVSLPCWELFDQQDLAYRESVLGDKDLLKLSVEAGTTIGWQRYTGMRGRNVGIDRYGASGPGAKVLSHFGFTAEHVAAEALRLLGRKDEADAIDTVDNGETAGQQAVGDEGHS